MKWKLLSVEQLINMIADLFQGNIIIDEDILIVRTLTTYLKKSNPISIMTTILMAILLV